jgi:hypothetical protein
MSLFFLDDFIATGSTWGRLHGKVTAEDRLQARLLAAWCNRKSCAVYRFGLEPEFQILQGY